MHVVELALKNWGPFRGEHLLSLDRRAYAVVANREGDFEDSNGGGKSMLLEAVQFALFGPHRFRTDDDLISRGEDIGEVRVTFDTGHRVVRRRERGKRKTLYLHAPGDPHGATQDRAQELLDQLLCLSSDDFLYTSYLEQRHMHRFVRNDPGSKKQRMEMVSAWLRLGSLERCEARSNDLAKDLSRRKEVLLDEVRQVDEAKGQFDDFWGQASNNEIPKILAKLAEKTEQVRREKAVLQARLVDNAKRIAAEGQRRQLADAETELRAAKEQADSNRRKGLKKDFEESVSQLREAEHRARMQSVRAGEKGRLAVKFGGTCPVTQLPCPARQEVEDNASARQKVAREASEEADAALFVADKARKIEGLLRVEHQAQERMDHRVALLSQHVDSLSKTIPDQGEPSPHGDLEAALRTVELRLEETKGREDRARHAASEEALLAERRRRLSAELGEVEAKLATARAASSIFGKNGAQRRIAKDAVSEIEGEANAVLSEVGAGVQVEVRWSREGNEPAKHCASCGQSFPKSARKKECERCGAARGKNVIAELDVILSDRSGALEDLSGIAMQLAASAWLRRDRGSPFSVVMIDEPTAAMDRFRRRSFTAHMARMLAASEVDQALVVSHSPEVLESLPGKILITRNADGFSRVKVTT